MDHISQATKERQTAWDRRNLRTVSTHLRREDAEDLKLMCYHYGTTPYALVRDFLLSYLDAGRHGRLRRAAGKRRPHRR